MNNEWVIDALRPDDWPTVKAIYEAGIATGSATFETQAPEWNVWDKGHRQDCRLVARSDGQVIGWSALSPVSGRCVYAGVVESSVYIAEASRGQGLGKALLHALITESEKAGIWTVQTGIFPENVASIALHKACGFREVGYRERIGCMNGWWRDVVFLERRSQIVGVS